MYPPSSVCLSASQRWGTSLWVFSSTSLLCSPQRCFTTKKTQRLQLFCQAVALTGKLVRPPAQTTALHDVFGSGNQGTQVENVGITIHFHRKWVYYFPRQENLSYVSIAGGQRLWLRERTWILFTAPSSALNPMRATWNLWQGYIIIL